MLSSVDSKIACIILVQRSYRPHWLVGLLVKFRLRHFELITLQHFCFKFHLFIFFKSKPICDVAWRTLHLWWQFCIQNYSVLEHLLSFKMTPYSLKLIDTIRCYKWNTAGNSLKSFLIFYCPFSPISWLKYLP